MPSTQEKKKIIDDLLIKRPVGPRGTNTYTSSTDWSYDKCKDVISYKCQKDFYGYEPLEIYELELHSHSDVERYVLQRFYNDQSTYELSRGQKGGVSRKTNRLYERVQEAVKHINRVGATGIYRVREGYYGRNNLGYIHANSIEDAHCKAKLLFSYVCNDSKEIRVDFMSLGDAGDLSSKTSDYEE
jgi:hypothetical protein